MNPGKTVFAQLMSHLSLKEFRKCVNRYRGNHKVRSFSCWDQFLCMAFAQFTWRRSLRDVETCLRAMRPRLYHMGIRGKVSRSTLADANQKRDWRIYADFAQILIRQARHCYQDEDFGLHLDETVYALDSSTIALCLSLFPWARFRKKKGAVKLHTLLDLRGNIPVFIEITDGKVHDLNVLDTLIPEAGALYLMDRAYIKFRRLYDLNQHHSRFIVRAKKNLQFRRRYSHPIDKTTGLRSDQTIVLTGLDSQKDYPEKLRRVTCFDQEKKKRLAFLTNDFVLPALTITELYRRRWQIELFFKWIKQHLRIEVFYGTSENAVKTQIWIAICCYLMAAIAKKRLKIDGTLYSFLQIIGISLFEKTPILQVLTQHDYKAEDHESCKQLNLFDL